MSETPVQYAQPDLDDLLSDEAVNRPFDYLRRLRDHDPVYFNERWNGWILTRHADVWAGFRDHNRLSSDRFAGPFGEEWQSDAKGANTPKTLFQFLSKFFVWKDPPYHTRVRSLVNKAFTPSSVESLRPRIRSLVEEFTEPLRGRDDVDFIGEFAFQLPVVVISEYLGVPPDARGRLKQWSDDLGSVIFVRGDDENRIERATQAVEELIAFLRPTVAARRADPQDDLLSRMLQAEERGDFLSEDEVLANVILMVFAGHETTMNLLANGLVAFDRHPDEWERLQADPSLARTAVEEILRYDGPIHAMARWAKVPIEIGGKTIQANDRVLLHQTAANHDPAVFADPDRIDISRRPNPHVAFGKGIHTCLGGPLARLEAEEVFGYFAAQFDRVAILTEELRYQPTIVSRSLQQLHVRFDEK